MDTVSVARLLLGAGSSLAVVLAFVYLMYRATLRHRLEMAKLRFSQHAFENSMNADGLDGYSRLRKAEKGIAASGQRPDDEPLESPP